MIAFLSFDWSTFAALTVVGIVTGAIYAVAASGLVVTYTTSGIFNFAHGAIGMIMAFLYWELSVNQGWPQYVALPFVLFIAAPLFGAAIERGLMRRLHGSPTGVSLVVTLGLMLILLGTSSSVWAPNRSRILPPFFVGKSVEIFGVVVTWHQLTVIVVAGLVAAGLRLLLFNTRIGTAMRAVVDDRELLSLNGSYPERVSQLSWAIGSSLAAVAGILLAPLVQLEALILTLLVINGYAAAMVGRLRSLPLTFAGAVILGLIESYFIGYATSISFLARIRPALPTVFLFVMLLFLPQARLRAGRIAAGARTPNIPTMRASLGSGAGLIVAVTILSTQLSAAWRFHVGSALAFGLIMLSLVLLTGYGGQVSLCQFAFVGIGAVAAGRLVEDGGLLGLAVAGVVSGVIGVIVSLPALRLQGLYLALSTMSIALFAEKVFFEHPSVFELGEPLRLERFSLLGLSFSGEQSQVILLSIVFSLAGVFVLHLRRGPFGRKLRAMNDSPIAAANLGLNMVRTKAVVFGTSAAMAGMAGVLYAGLRTTVSSTDFAMLQSLVLLLGAVIGGITTVTGALLGGVVLALLPVMQDYIPASISLQGLAIGGGAVLLSRNPNGIAGYLSPLADRAGELVARLRSGAPGIELPDATIDGGLPDEVLADELVPAE